MTRHHTFLLVVLLSTFSGFAFGSERWDTLRAINMVENPTNQTGYGSRGELGPYQFRSSTWRMHTNKPFRMANDRATADQVAVKHYEWIKDRLVAAGIDANSYNIALAWNCGITAVLNGRIPMQTYYYADRVNNLAADYHQVEIVAEKEIPVVLTEKSASGVASVSFRLPAASAAPEFKIVADPIRFHIAGESPRFFLTPPQQRFALASN